MQQFDLIVLGSGPSGGRVAMTAAKDGMKVAIVEANQFGGTCALRGCNPKKVFVHAAQVVDAARRSDGKLCSAGDVKIDWPDLFKFKQTFVESIPQNSREKFDDAGITTILGQPSFTNPSTISVAGDLLTATNLLIATGSRPTDLDIAGEEFITSSDQFMDLQALPKRIAFVGGGYISMEFAHVANRAGAEVIVFDRGDRPLKTFDAFTVNLLVKKSQAMGIDFQFNSQPTSITQSCKHLSVNFQRDDLAQSVEVDLVVHGAGRIPNLEGLNLKTANVEFDAQKGVLVNDQMRSLSNPRVFASGDCAASSQPRLTPVANQQGYAIGKQLGGDTSAYPDYSPIPKAVFTVPSLAAVGLTIPEAEERGLDFRVNQKNTSDAGNIRKVCQSHAGYSVLIDNQNDQIIGAHLFGPSAAETINLFAVAIKAGMTSKELKSVLITFPTFASDVRTMVG
jgi:glutathione reductase (NADPH)